MDKPAKDAYNQDLKANKSNVYRYKNVKNIPDLSYIDDYLGISKCGLESLEKNVHIKTSIELKRLNFNVGEDNRKSKCLKMHVGRNKTTNNCIPLSIRGKPMETVSELVYLGDIVTNCGRNMTNIKSRVSKGIGIIGQIFTILESVTFGSHFFTIALHLGQSMLLNSVLVNCEAWYDLSTKELKEISQLDSMFFTRLCRLPSSSPKIAFFLEFGEFDIETTIKSRRVIYWHSILTQKRNQFVYSFAMTQYY